MAAFETVGKILEEGVAGYSESISSALISNISPVLLTCVSLYFLLKGWMFLSGRAEGALADTVITAFKIALISMVGLNSGNFVSWGMGFINGMESLLLSSLPNTSATSGWMAIDKMWEEIGNGIVALWHMIGSIGFTEVGYAFFLILLLFTFFIAGAFLTLSALGVFIIAKLALTVVIGFGPLFICLLMFPVTRMWFDGWLKTCMTFIFTVVILAAVISLVSTVFANRIDQISSYLTGNFDKGSMAKAMTSIFTFLIVCFSLATLVKTVPTMASGITSGVGFASVSLLQMLKGINQGGYNVIQASKNTIAKTAAAENSIGNAAWSASNASVRSMRALNAAYSNLSALPQKTNSSNIINRLDVNSNKG